MKVLFLLTNMLGGSTYSRNLIQVVKQYSNVIKSDFFFFEKEDYVNNYRKLKYLPMKLAKFDSFIFSFILKDKVNQVGINIYNYDVLFFGSIHLIPAFAKYIAKIPTILAFDQTPSMYYKMLKMNTNSAFKKFKLSIRCVIENLYINNYLKKIKVFLPMSDTCKHSLIYEYGIDEKHVILTPGYVNIQFSKNFSEKRYLRKKLLFVGNDFFRKGGDILLEIIKRLPSDYSLTIVSNDKKLENIKLQNNITWIRGITNPADMKDVYESSSLFVFPTRRDASPHVLCEAAASGLPAIATDIGGISSIVKEGETGRLMSFYANSDEWVKVIQDMFENIDNMINMAKKAQNRWHISSLYYGIDVYMYTLNKAFRLAFGNNKEDLFFNSTYQA